MMQNSQTQTAPKKKAVLLIHCKYLQNGGEDKVVAEESQLLQAHYEVRHFIRSNEELLQLSKLAQLGKSIWNFAICKELSAELKSFQPDIVHVHNTFPLLSPAIFQTLRRWKNTQKAKQSVRIVHTLHNFRLHCPQASLMRPQHKVRSNASSTPNEPSASSSAENAQSTLCQRCIQQNSFLPAIRAKCYRSNRLMTTAIAIMLSLHKKLGTWQKSIDCYIYLNSSQKTLLTQVGFPAEKFIYKPNFLSTKLALAPESDPQRCWQNTDGELRLLFFGRLSEEKGLKIVLSSLELLRSQMQPQAEKAGKVEKAKEIKKIQLRIAGTGPLQEIIEKQAGKEAKKQAECKTAKAATSPEIEISYLGQLENLEQELRHCHFAILASIWYEGMPMTLLESLRSARPVIGFCLGAHAEVLTHRQNGILAPFFRNAVAQQQLDLSQVYNKAELAENLANAITEAYALSPESYTAMCRAAKNSYQHCYSPEKNLQSLRAIYEDSL